MTLVVSMCVLTSVDAQKTPSAEVMKLREDLIKAETDRDRALLEQIFDEHLIVIYASGRLADRAEHISRLVSRATPLTESKIDSVIMVGETAVITERYGPDLTTRATLVAAHKERQWKVVTLQFATVQPTK